MVTRFGNPILRQKHASLSATEIKSDRVQQLIGVLKETIASNHTGVGLAAPQVGKSLRIAIIDIKPTKLRPHIEKYQAVIINPAYEGIGRRVSLWEGCLSSGSGKNTLYAKALRYKKIRASWLDQNAVKYEEEISGTKAHVFQHETDHLNGILFVDRVRDTTTFMMADEYHKRIVKG